MPDHCFVRYLFFKQVRVTMETSRVMMEKRKASSESAEADKQYLGKISRDMAVISISIYIRFITLIICVFLRNITFFNCETSCHLRTQCYLQSGSNRCSWWFHYNGQCFCCKSVFEVRMYGVRPNAPSPTG